MRTAIDSNVLSAIWSAEASVPQVLKKMKIARSEGALLICPAVFSELHAYPGATEAFVRGFLDSTGIVVDYRMEEVVWSMAGERFARYAERRRKVSGESSRRLLADFLIGAHALVQAERLFTLDVSRYERDFPELRLL